MRSKIVRSLLALIVGLASANVVSAATDIVMRQIPVDNDPGRPSISADGRYIAYVSATRIYIHDVVENRTQLASVGINGETPLKPGCTNPKISAEGRHVVFLCSVAAELGALNYIGGEAAFVYDRVEDRTEVIPSLGADRIYRDYTPAISADGRHVAIRTVSADQGMKIFVRNRSNKTTSQVPGKFAEYPGIPNRMTISPDGRMVSYTGRFITGSSTQGLMAYDRVTGVTDMLNVAYNGRVAAQDISSAQTSEDGSIGVFSSMETGLSALPAPSFTSSVFVRDRKAGTTIHIPQTPVGGAANPVVSANGRFVALMGSRLFYYDRLTKIMRPVVTDGLSGSFQPDISRDGRYIAFGAIRTDGKRVIAVADMGVPAGVVASASELSLVRGGDAATYTLVLTQAPTADVQITVASGSQLRFGRDKLTFTAENWNVPQVVSVQALRMSGDDAQPSATIVHTISSEDVNFAVAQVNNVNVKIAAAVAPTLAVPGPTWTSTEMPVTGTAAPGATVIVNVYNRTSNWTSGSSVVADNQGRWNLTVRGLSDGVIELDATADGIKSAVQTVTVKLAATTPPAEPSYIDVTGYIRTTAYGLILNRSTGNYAGDFVLTNTGSINLKGPLHVQLNALTSTATLVNATGMHDGAPYITVDADLAPDQSVTIPLLFTNPTRVNLNYEAKIYSGKF